jgi:ribosomal protein RSM22 (predicted rRNA methylase)
MLAANETHPRTIEATFIENDEGALTVAQAIARTRKAEGSIALQLKTARTLTETGKTLFDIIVVGQSLGEMRDDDDGEVELLEDLLTMLGPAGSLVVVEPALRERTRRLHRVRDRLVASGKATVFAPCLHQKACPALATADAWCHEDLPIDLPERVAALARAAGLRWQGLTFAYLVLRKDGVSLEATTNGAYRVVSAPIVTKGKRELFVCGRGERRKLARLDRDGSRGDVWSRAARGDLLALDPMPAGTRLGGETVITKL